MRKILLIVASLIFFLLPVSVMAQGEELDLRLTRDFGYGAGGQIQGKFSLRVDGSANIVRVDFIIDGEVVHTITEAPFRFRFETLPMHITFNSWPSTSGRFHSTTGWLAGSWRRICMGHMPPMGRI